MADTISGQPLTVLPDERAGPYLSVTVDQLAAVRAVLDRHGVSYWVDPEAIRLAGRPAVTVVNFGRRGDARQLQELLDAVRPRG